MPADKYINPESPLNKLFDSPLDQVDGLVKQARNITKARKSSQGVTISVYGVSQVIYDSLMDMEPKELIKLEEMK